MLHPRLIAKRPLTMLLFIVFAVMLAVFAEPKPFEMLRRPAMNLSLATVVVGMLVTEVVLFAIIWVTLESRYAVAAQTQVATFVFLLIVTIASLLGFWFHMTFVGDVAGAKRAFGPAAYTFREGLVAVIALTATGSAFTVAHNLAFLRKADYTQFHHAHSELLKHIDAMKTQFDKDEPLSDAGAAKLKRLSASAATALSTPIAAETGAYQRFIDEWIRDPLTKIGSLASNVDVANDPQLFLRACGLAQPSDPWDSDYVAEMSAAYQKLETAR